MALETLRFGALRFAFAGFHRPWHGDGTCRRQEISWIYCGDKMDPIHEKYIKEWEGKNAGWKVVPEVVGWEHARIRPPRSLPLARRFAMALCRFAHVEAVCAERSHRSGADVG